MCSHFHNLVRGDCDSVQRHQQFYEEYMAVMDLPAEFYLQTIDQVFHERALAAGTLTHRGTPVDCSAIRKTALMTVEGEKDDICAVGQTEAAHDTMRQHPDRHEVSLSSAGRRSLRRLQRTPLERRNSAAHPGNDPDRAIQAAHIRSRQPVRLSPRRIRSGRAGSVDFLRFCSVKPLCWSARTLRRARASRASS